MIYFKCNLLQDTINFTAIFLFNVQNQNRCTFFPSLVFLNVVNVEKLSGLLRCAAVLKLLPPPLTKTRRCALRGGYGSCALIGRPLLIVMLSIHITWSGH